MADDRTFYLYRHFDAAGVLLYVGISVDWSARHRAHRRDAEWFDRISRIEIERHPGLISALDAEARVIAGERPLFNRTNVPEVGQWVEQCCSLDNSAARTRGRDLFEHFMSWCAARGHRALTATAFGRSLSEMGMHPVKDGRGNIVRVGIALRGAPPRTPGERTVDGQLAQPSVLSNRGGSNAMGGGETSGGEQRKGGEAEG